MKISWSRSVLKAVAKQQRSGQSAVLRALSEVVRLLGSNDRVSQATLRQGFRDHALKGDLHGKRELHLAQDTLLVYRMSEATGTVILLDIVSHEELRKK